MKIKIIAVGKIKKQWIHEGINEYLKRITNLEIIEIKDSNKSQEAEKIITLIKPHEKLIILSEEGESFTSVALANLIKNEMFYSFVFALGSAEGIAPELKQNAHKILSLSKMTFPHEIARLLLIEQIYRANTIINNHKYHK
jgi:23S rRNA (pseudouridine1915-N3)-methyltransferase